MPQIKTLFVAMLSTFTLSATAQWTEVEWPQTDGLWNIDFVDDLTGYAQMSLLQGFTSSFEKTVDGGQTWTEWNTPVSAIEIQDMDFLVTGEGALVTRTFSIDGTLTRVYRTLDDGDNWEDISPDDVAIGFGLAQIQMLNANTIFFVTDNYFYRTTNGGDDWSAVLLPHAGVSVNFSDADRGLVGTWDGTFLYSGGILATIDGGETWNELVLDVNNTAIGVVHQFNETTAYAAPVKWGGSGQSQFYKTIDNGTNWTTVMVPETEDNATLSGFDFRDENYGVVTLNSNEQCYIYKTTDGGENWDLQNEVDQLYIADLDLTPSSGYIVDDNGVILRLNAPLGVSEYHEITLRVFPNPVVSGQIIEWDATADFTKVRIVDVRGKTVFQENLILQNATIPTLHTGVYCLTLQNEMISKTVKILVD